MGNKGLTIWLIILTIFVGINYFAERDNLQIRNKNTLERTQKFEEIETRFKRLERHLNGPLREELNQIKKYLHKH